MRKEWTMTSFFNNGGVWSRECEVVMRHKYLPYHLLEVWIITKDRN